MSKEKGMIYRRKYSQMTIGEFLHVFYRRLYQFIQIVPLIILIDLYLKSNKGGADIANAFIVSGIYAFAVMLLLYIRGNIIDRMILSLNTYILVGGIAYMLQIYPLMRLFVYLDHSGIFATNVLVGFFTILFSPYGFVGVDHKSLMHIYFHSFNLLIISVFILTISLYFQGNEILGAVIPLMILGACHRWFKTVLIRTKT